jgi:hypothetical protein
VIWRALSPPPMPMSPIATTDAYVTSRRERKKVEMLFAHLKRILKLDRLRLRGSNGARDKFHLAAAAQNLRKLAMLIPLPAPIPATRADAPVRGQTPPQTRAARLLQIRLSQRYQPIPDLGY